MGILIFLIIILIVVIIFCGFKIAFLYDDVEIAEESAFQTRAEYRVLAKSYDNILEKITRSINEFNNIYSNTQLELADDICALNDGAGFNIIDLDKDE